MSTPILNLLSNLSEESEKKLTPHKELRAEGWRKTGSDATHHHYTHPEHVGHTISLHKKTGEFQHTVLYDKSLHQKGKDVAHRSELAKHLNTHHRQVSYSHTAQKHGDNWDRGRSGYSDGPGPRGYQG